MWKLYIKALLNINACLFPVQNVSVAWWIKTHRILGKIYADYIYAEMFKETIKLCVLFGYFFRNSFNY
jgi:hypothetical protein